MCCTSDGAGSGVGYHLLSVDAGYPMVVAVTHLDIHRVPMPISIVRQYQGPYTQLRLVLVWQHRSLESSSGLAYAEAAS